MKFIVLKIYINEWNEIYQSSSLWTTPPTSGFSTMIFFPSLASPPFGGSHSVYILDLPNAKFSSLLGFSKWPWFLYESSGWSVLKTVVRWFLKYGLTKLSSLGGSSY